MRLIQGSQKFSFNYATYDQNPGLFVAFNVYDVSSGVAVFIGQVAGVHAAFGAYMAEYMPAENITYLVIGIVYTDDTYLVVDDTRSPSVEVYQTIASSLVTFGFAYSSYDLNDLLHVRASVYNMTTGTPVFVGTRPMADVDFGVYFGTFDATLGQTYQAIGVVYTSGTFVTPDPNRSPSCDELDSFRISPELTVLGQANLVGQQLAAILTGDS